MPGRENNNRRGWSTRPLRNPDEPPYRMVNVRFPAQLGADLALLARYEGTTSSGEIRDLVEHQINWLDRTAPDWRTTARITDPYAPDNYDA